MHTYEIEEKLIGELRGNHRRSVDGTDVEIAMGRLQVWDSSSLDEGRPRLVAAVALERLVSFKVRGGVITWDGIERRNRPIPIWDGVERRRAS